ncbi:MAG: hypothetical protein KAS96_09485 [Planctomycetes bacterium]|nr:hypothetical protein [Planctomycetota bacterium]
MTKAKRTAIKLRWVLLSLWVLCFVSGLIWVVGIYFEFGAGVVGSPAAAFFGPFNGNVRCWSEGWPYAMITPVYIGFFFFTQWLFLSPRKLWKIKTRIEARPMKKAAIAAAFAVTLLITGLGYSILDLFSVKIPNSPINIFEYLILLSPLILWIFWSIIFCVYYRQTDYYTWASRIIRGLIAGSVLELFVSIPIFVTREDDCYCDRGSYAGIVFGATVLLWAFGPAVFLLFLRQKHQIEKLNPKSENAPPD